MSNWLSYFYIIFVAPIGALGAFFSGSTTVSNLTFGAIQQNAAISLRVSQAIMLALQTAAGAAGNMVCLSNIIAAKSVVGSLMPEGVFIKKTMPICVVHCFVITICAGLAFWIDQ